MEDAIRRFVIDDDDDDACSDEEFALSEVSNEERDTVIGGNEYLRGLRKNSGLEIIEEKKLSTLGVMKRETNKTNTIYSWSTSFFWEGIKEYGQMLNYIFKKEKEIFQNSNYSLVPLISI